MKNPAVTTTFQAKTRESIERFVELIENTRGRLLGKSEHPLPSARPSPRGEGESLPAH